MGINQSTDPELNADSMEYFELLHQKIRSQNTHLNRKNKSNNQSAKKWKDVIIKYLTKQHKIGIIWAKELCNNITKNKFQNENKFLDLFFWQKFEMKTKPKCLNPNASMSTTVTREPRHTDLSMSEYQLNKEKVQKYIKIFQSHLKSPEHPISICIEMFVDTFCNELELYLYEINTLSTLEDKISRAKVVTETITQQLIFFLFKIQKCFGLMYSKILSNEIFLHEKEEFTTLFTSQFFSHKRLYELIIYLLTISKADEITKLNEHIAKLNEYNITPNEVGINPKFRLNRSTEKTQLSLLFKDNVDISDEKLIYLNSYHKKKGYVPYQSSIDLLRNIKAYQTPYEKITLLSSMSTDVIDNVMEAWKPLEEYLPKNYLNIDGDELLLIFSFIVIKAQIPDLLAHLYFIKLFTTQDTKSSMIGYYYSTIEGSIITVKGIDKEKVKSEFSKKTQNGLFYENVMISKEINNNNELIATNKVDTSNNIIKIESD